jgi:hypothetical protein
MPRAKVQAPRPCPSPGRRTLEIVGKSQVPPLTPQQRELVSIFIWYLRDLTPTEDFDDILNRVLTYYFKKKYPDWKINAEQKTLLLDDLPDEAAEKFADLITHACCPPSVAVKRRKSLLELASVKRRLVWSSGVYERMRQDLGLAPDPDVQPLSRPKTPLELAASEMWGSMTGKQEVTK